MAPVSRRHVLTGVAAASAAAVLAPGSMTAALAGQDGPREHHVEIHKFKFSPAELTVKPGDTITWTNHDIAPHTATARDKTWDTGTIKKGEAGSIVATADMPTDYFCRFHPQMKASLKLLA